jgi:hypothetical protein
MTTVGFLLLKNSPDFSEKELFKATKAFHHDLPNKEKELLKLKHFRSKS